MIQEQVIQRIREFGSKSVDNSDRLKLIDWVDLLEKRIIFKEAEKKIIAKFGACLAEIRNLL